MLKEELAKQEKKRKMERLKARNAEAAKAKKKKQADLNQQSTRQNTKSELKTVTNQLSSQQLQTKDEKSIDSNE